MSYIVAILVATAFWKYQYKKSFVFIVYGIIVGIIFTMSQYLTTLFPRDKTLFIIFGLHDSLSLCLLVYLLTLCKNPLNNTWEENVGIGIGIGILNPILPIIYLFGQALIPQLSIDYFFTMLKQLIQEIATIVTFILPTMLIIYAVNTKKWIHIASAFFYKALLSCILYNLSFQFPVEIDRMNLLDYVQQVEMNTTLISITTFVFATVGIYFAIRLKSHFQDKQNTE